MPLAKPLPTLAVLGALLLAISAHGADPEPSPPVDHAATDQSLGTEFGRGAEEVTARLKDLERSLADGAVIGRLEAEVASYTHRTATHWHDTSRLLARNLRTTALDSLTTYWQALHADLDAVDASITARLARRDAELASVMALKESWAHALQVARDAQEPPAVIDRVQQTIDAIERTRPSLEQRRARLLVMQNAVARAFQHTADAQARIADARGEALARMLTPQESPLWRAAPQAPAGDGDARRADLVAKLDNVTMYVTGYRARLLLSLAILVGLIVLLQWGGRRLAEVAAEAHAAGTRRAVLHTPFAAGILIGLLITLPLRPPPPYEFQQAVLAVLLTAAVAVLRASLDGRERAALYLAYALYLLNFVSQLLEPAPRAEQLLLLGEMTVMASLLTWAARRLAPARFVAAPAPPLRALLRGLAGVLALGCAVSAIASAVGYLDLADLLGIGLLLVALVSVGLLAVRVALGDLIAVALAHGPLARLRTVENHGETLGRALRGVLDVCIVLVWTSLLLGRFELRESARELLRDTLDTTLRAGGLELPVGHVLAFVAVLVVGYGVTRFVVILFEEDVYSRMTLPRGVPYALSTLTRYALLLAGFLLALGALGLDLTRITVLVSALGLGLGFGLQQIMNNFVSGLILLFERPVQVGDSIQMDSLLGEVVRIGIRSSTVRTSQGAEVIVPNAKMIEEKVTNWTLTDRRRRFDLELSVSGETAVAQVMSTMEGVAHRHPKVLSNPAPAALLVRIGRNANHFQLRFWTDDPAWIRVWSELAVELQQSLHDVRTSHAPGLPPVPGQHA